MIGGAAAADGEEDGRAGAWPRGPWRSLEQVELATAGWVDWWNQRRLHSADGDLPSAEYEALYYRQRDTTDVA